MTYDGGIVVLDASSLEVLADFELDGFNRLNSVGDGRHVGVSTSGGWALVDSPWRRGLQSSREPLA